MYGYFSVMDPNDLQPESVLPKWLCLLIRATSGLDPFDAPTRAQTRERPARTVRSRAHTRRAMPAASAGVISPCATAPTTAGTPSRTASTLLNADRSLPTCFARPDSAPTRATHVPPHHRT